MSRLISLQDEGQPLVGEMAVMRVTTARKMSAGVGTVAGDGGWLEGRMVYLRT